MADKMNKFKEGDLVVITDGVTRVDGQSATVIDPVPGLFGHMKVRICNTGEIWNIKEEKLREHYVPESSSLANVKQDKLRLAELHPEFEVFLTKAMTVGFEKGYGKDSWIDTDKYPTVTMLNAAMRHINKFRQGEIYNIEEGCKTTTQHLAHAAFNLLACAVQVQNEREGDSHDE